MERLRSHGKYRHIGLLIIPIVIVLLTSLIIPSATAATNTLPQAELLRQIDLSPFNLPDSSDPTVPPDFYRASAQFGDLNNDNVYKDFIRYTNARLQAFTYDGGTTVTKLWEYNAPVALPPAPERYFYKYALWDIDLDGQTEVIGPFATSDGIVIRIVDGATGAVEKEIDQFGSGGKLPLPTSDSNNRTLRIYTTIVNVRGTAEPQDVAVLTEADSNGDIFVYNYNSSNNQFTLDWDTTADNATKEKIYAHYVWNGDIDNDGKDEFLGTWVFDDDGTRLTRLTPSLWEPDDFFFDHLDRGFIGDFDPNRPGLEALISFEYVYARMYSAADLVNAGAQPIWSQEDLPGPSENQRPGNNNSDENAKITSVGEFTVDAGTVSGVEIAYERAAYRALDPEETGIYNIAGVEPKTIIRIQDGFHADWDGDRTVDESIAPRNGSVSAPWNNGETIEIEELYYDNGGPALTQLPEPDLNGNGQVDSNEDMRVYAYPLDIVGDYREEVIIIDNDEMAIYGATGTGPEKLMSPWVDPTYRLALANSAYDNHPERPWFDWRAITPQPLKLTSICDGEWRVRNTNNYDVAFAWDVYQGSESGTGVATANSDVFFNTSTGPKTVRLFVNGAQITVKASNPASCSP